MIGMDTSKLLLRSSFHASAKDPFIPTDPRPRDKLEFAALPPPVPI